MMDGQIAVLLRDQIERLWGAGEIELVDQLYAESVVDHMPVPGQRPGREPMKRVVEQFRAGLPDMKMELHGTIACGDVGVDFWTLTATHAGPLFGRPATGRPVRFSGIDMVRVADGRIADLWHVEEMLQLEGQIGDGPPAFGQVTGREPIRAAVAEADPAAAALGPDPARLSPIERRNLEIARRHIEGIWAKGDAELAWAMYAPDVVDHNPAPDQRPGIAGIVDVLGWLREAVPDLSMSIRQYVVEGDLAADRWVMRGTHSGGPLLGLPPRGRSFEINGMDVIRIRPDGLISDVWHVEEFARLREQIAAPDR